MSIITAAIRGAQFVFAVIVLGLYVSMAKKQEFGSPPATTTYGAFTGGFGILAAIVCLAALWVEFLALVSIAADGLTALLMMAGGIALFVQNDFPCSHPTSFTGTVNDEKFLNGGCDSENCGIWIDIGGDSSKLLDEMAARCKQLEAGAAFQIIACITAFAAAGLMLWRMKKGTGRTGVVV